MFKAVTQNFHTGLYSFRQKRKKKEKKMAAATSSSSSSSSTVIVEIKEGLEPYVRSDSGTLTLHAIKDHMIGPDDALLLEWEGLTFMESPSTMVWGRAAPNLPTGLVVMLALLPSNIVKSILR